MSSYVETLLTPDETIQAEAKQHWVALIRFALQPLLILGAAIICLLIGQWLSPGDGFLSGIMAILDTLVGLLTLGLFILAIVWLPAQIVRWTQRRFVVTNRRVILAAGLMRRTSQEARLEKITDVGYLESFLGRQMGFGDLSVSTAAGPLKLDDIIGALEFKKIIMAAQEGMVRERAAEIMNSTLAPTPSAAVTAAVMPPTSDVEPPAAGEASIAAAAVATSPVAPPSPAGAVSATAASGVPATAASGVPATAAGAVSATAASGVPATAATPVADDADVERAESPEEITALLARLADLRDSGAISGEEYEAKKQELLGRL